MDQLSPLDVKARLSSGVVLLGSVSGSVAIDASKGCEFRMTATGNVTLLNPSNLKDGDGLVFAITQDGTGGHTVSLDSKYSDASGAAAALRKTASKVEFLTALYDLAADKLRVFNDYGFAWT